MRCVGAVAQAGPPDGVEEPDALVVEQAGLRALAAGPDVLAGELDVPAAEPDAPVGVQGGLPEPDAPVVAQGGPPAAWAGLWFRVVELYAWAAAVPSVLAA